MINNPTDSVCDYLAELLYEETPAPEPEPALAMVGQKSDQLVGRAVVQTSPKPSPAVQPSYLEAPSFDKEKLAKLLRSAPLAPQPSNAPAPVAPKASPPTAVEQPIPKPALSETSPVLEPEASEASEPVKEIAWCENGRPSWAQERFDVLLFKVHGLTLAVPLIALGQIQPITQELTPIFGQAKWFMGLQPTPMGQIKTVNTALFVMPERYDPAFLASAKYVISIDGLNWGLAVDSVQQPRTLDPEDVKWRQGRGLRPWLAGTVKEHMCALIDIPNMGVILAGSDKNTKKSKGV
ncbi:chemotaxis protein CheW [Simiduia curdlanivorans]|uniref:Chemotaxis protein CheW n=1 Tax=Simiduia curdlanivorans TaxID=1492769 RepID=A0ABV8V7Y0_9GAMM|nr:chemotaxis protein CheW [Simiduia curdlanivorans]MDN3639884.1 chemotaxis protein CheW [Simiduia curdlanivorans]